MLEAAETRPTVSVEQYEQLEPGLRTELIQMQQELRTARFPLIAIVSGDDAEGARDVLNLFSEWMDPRFVLTRVFADPTWEERHRPLGWRYWRVLPANGRTAVFSDEWTTRALAMRVAGELGPRKFAEAMEASRRFESMLAVDGAVFVKLYIHKPQDELEKQRKRLKREAPYSDVATIGEAMLKRPMRTRRLVEEMLQQSSTGLSPWRLVEGTCKRYRNIAVARHVMEAVRGGLSRAAGKASPDIEGPKPPPATLPAKSVLAGVDLSLDLGDDEYDQEMSRLRKELRRLTMQAQQRKVTVVAAFEGWDAAGKGGTIRRLAQSMNPENYRIVPIAAPNDDEKAHHYLWRFWRHIPADGGFVIFDRTWYGRVLVERVEKFATPQEWGRAYDEINFFEQRLTEHGTIVLKFWLHIDQDEQLRRFKEREDTPFKQYKIGPEDYRNREKWDQYVAAIDEMVARTSTPSAPWHLIPSNSKKYARVDVLRKVVEALAQKMGE